ncbi:toxin-activating lysine-acyltransferase [Polynucleobacter sp. AM-25C3]|uniref:toxin-activating lysine-acyltransferase n=1 Tax=Polynucleobacter sp. AM-25C3 TaxID=1855569 RepID=UPI001C0D197A|nr:toxin-activating lysine-acyltransferase [Polynucleobacter sp. AM-25C3]MBU3602155.1 toxin-activating lysine-acyltransferase [Polynucleobacter sp. AM-25C3]
MLDNDLMELACGDSSDDSRKLFFSNLGKIAYLWGCSNLHKDWPVHLIRQYVQPALELNQYLILEGSNGIPLAYISWACLSIEAEVKYLENPHSIGAEEWNGGNRIWFMDLVSPFDQKYTNEIIRRLRSTIFSKVVARSLRIKLGSKTSKVAFYWGKQVTPHQREAMLQYLYETAKEASKAEKIIWSRTNP